MHIKIRGGTPTGGKSLCLQCKRATLVRGQNCEELIFCSGPFRTSVGSGGGVVPFKVTECGQFQPVNMPWKHEMEQMAWTIEARKRGPSGFQPEETEMEVVITPPGSHESDE